METPNFIESYQTNAFDLCDAITDRLNYLLNEQFNGLSDEEKRLQGFMQGSQTNGGQDTRTDFSVDF